MHADDLIPVKCCWTGGLVGAEYVYAVAVIGLSPVKPLFPF
jgi:hypothetical protein